MAGGIKPPRNRNKTAKRKAKKLAKVLRKKRLSRSALSLR
jgi:hypothetical protein